MDFAAGIRILIGQENITHVQSVITFGYCNIFFRNIPTTYLLRILFSDSIL